PPGEFEIGERGERNHIADFGRTAFGALPEAHRAHLRQRADRLGKSFSNRHHAGDERGADRAEANQQHAEFAARWSNINRSRHERKLYNSLQLSAISSQLSALSYDSLGDESIRTTRRSVHARPRHDRREDGRPSGTD